MKIPFLSNLLRASKKSADEQTAFSFSAPIDLTAEAQGVDGKTKLPSFKITAYTGVPMSVGFGYPVVLELSGVRAARQQIPVLFDHDPSRIIGQSSGIDIGAKGVSIEGSVTGSPENADVQTVMANAKNGFKWQASVGATITRREFLEAGKTSKVNGRDIAGPAIIARESVLREVSFVAMGADDNTAASVAASQATPPSTEDSTMTFEQWLKAKSIDPATLTAEVKATLQAAFDAEVKAKAPPAPAPGVTQPPQEPNATLTASAAADVRASVAAEHKRIALVSAASKGHPDITAKAIEENWTVEKTELETLRASRPKAPNTHAVNRDLNDGRVVEAALCLTAGMRVEQVEKSIPTVDREKVMNAALAGSMRGFSLHALLDSVIAAGGTWYNGNRKSNEFIRAAFEADRMLRASAGGFSSISLSGVLSAVANKSLIAAYTATEVVWNQIAGLRQNVDFKTHTAYRMDSTGAFKKIGPDGELKHIGLTDSSFTRRLDTFGAIVALTRQMIVNDDLNAFLSIPAMLGRLSALRIEEAVFVLLLSNPSSFFASGNGNYQTGAGTALSLTSLTAAELLFRNFVIDGKPVLTTPKKLLVGSALATTAENLFAEKLLIASGLSSTSSRTVEPARNPHAGKYPPVVSPYLNNTSIKDQNGAAITGQSATLWFLLADPAVRAAIVVAFLNGQSNPTIESAETSFDTLGMQWRAYSDFGVGMEETTAMVHSAGA